MRALRSLVVLALSGLAMTGSAQVWEKLLAPGLTYRMELDTNLPRILHAIRWTPKSASVTAAPELSEGNVYADTPNLGRETVSAMARRTGALAVVNADFFPFTGDPLGLMVRNGELVSLPFPNRIAFGWGSDIKSIRATSSLSFRADSGPSVPVQQLNEECKDNSIAVNSERAGYARAASMNCVHLVVTNPKGEWKVGGRVTGVVEQVVSGQRAIPIAKGSFVLTGLGTGAAELAKLRTGSLVEVALDLSGFEGETMNVVGGGPNLVSKGLIAVDGAEQGFKPDFTDKRHPRTAIGKTADGDVWIVAIDGRQKLSEGATIEELARVMQRLGCMEAINLDGGGSTTLNIFGMTMNRPSEGKEREIANGIAFYGSQPTKEAGTFTIVGPASIVNGSTNYFKILDAKGQMIPNAEVLWSATGSGWIDQGGFLRANSEGTVFLSAFVRGQLVPLGITVTPVIKK